MKIAIIGAGLCGLGLSWHLIHKNPSLNITLFDPLEPKDRTSSLAHLLYPYIGIKSKLSWNGEIAFIQAKKMVEELQKVEKEPLYSIKTLYKIPSSLKQQRDFEDACLQNSNLKIGLDPFFLKPALLILDAVQVNSEKYLLSFQRFCTKRGVCFEGKTFDESEAKNFDLIVYATGEKSNLFFKPGQTSRLKGQALILKKENNFNLENPVIYDGLHLIPSLDQKTLYVGNTFEREFESPSPCKKTALELLWHKFVTLFPFASQKDILAVKAGVRLNAPDRLPKIGPIHSNRYLFAAVGSKGLLYHSYLAEMLANHILFGSTIPKEVFFKLNKT